ncbi:hypothetical protein RIR_jg31236.t1 [Rhizophagus irregularis DAOM 181602=DAOM 197198]|nr:hypothetical protein RIR_jg31236.t1 [Rhizophagus irregularis DAOM 181602=DAOM 197198]
MIFSQSKSTSYINFIHDFHNGTHSRILFFSVLSLQSHVKIYLDINFYEERILSTLAKANRLHLLIEYCSACQNLLEY